jgi:hypothetical protein
MGLIEMQIEDPDGIRIILVEVPADHPARPAINASRRHPAHRRLRITKHRPAQITERG